MSDASWWAQAGRALIGISLLCMAQAEYWEAPSSKIWVYSLVGTDYDGYKMLPHFLDHYRSMGISDEHFHFDLLHDPSEPNDGVKVRHLTSIPLC